MHRIARTRIRIRPSLLTLTALLALGMVQGVDAQETETGTPDSSGDVSDSLFEDEIFADDLSDDFFADPSGTDSSTDIGDAVDPFADLDSLFDEEMVEVVEDPDAIVDPEQGLLESEELRWGGRIRGNLSTDFRWDTTSPDDFDPVDPDERALSPSIGADLFFDARPDPQFRAFGEFKIETSGSDDGDNLTGAINDAAISGDLPEGWTREEELETGDTVIIDDNGDEVFRVAAESDEEEYEPGTGTAPSLELSVYELFSDFNYREQLFFRFGKHTIQWGAGYFFSPADVLNLSAVDAEDPTADREGPVSLKTQYPFGINNAYLYLIANTGARPLEVAVAPKLEVVVGQTELTLAGYYQRALAPRIIGMFSTSVGEVDLFGEGVVSLGSDRVFVRASQKQLTEFTDPPDGLETVLDTYTIDWLPLVSATAGFRYLKELEEDRGSLLFLGQYFFNGEGYADSSLLEAAAFLAQNPDTNGLALDESAQPDDYAEPPALGFGDLSNWGRHYAAASLGWTGILGSDLGVTLFGLLNLSDLSGIVTPALQFPLLEEFSLSVSGRLTFGDQGDEYTNPAALFTGEDDATGGTFGLTLSIGLGGGSF